MAAVIQVSLAIITGVTVFVLWQIVDMAAIIQVSLTIITGVTVFVAGHMVVKLVIEPVQEMKSTIAQISHTLIELAPTYMTPGLLPIEKIKEADAKFKSLSGRIRSHLYLIPRFAYTSRIFGLPKSENVITASRKLIGLSNSLYQSKDPDICKHNARRVESICDALGIYSPYKEDRRSGDA